MPIDRYIPSSQRRARAIDQHLSEGADAHKGIVRTAENERGAASAHQQNLGHEGLALGKIVWSHPYLHWYRVQLDSGRSDLSCTTLSETSLQPFSVRSTSPIAPNTTVVVFRPTGSPFGFILGCLPYIVSNADANFSDWISQGSNGGFRRESYYRDFPTLFAKNGGAVDFSDQRPIDTSSIGEWGRFSSLGGGIFIDPFMSYMRVDESCGLWLFYMDRLARLCAHNYDFRSSVSEQVIRNDNGEGLNYHGSTPYAWEALGIKNHDDTFLRETDDKAVHYDAPYGKFEPQFDDQQPIMRYEEFRGYLGQGYMRQLSAPSSDAQNPHRYSDTKPPVGLFREQISLAGDYGLMAAHSFSFVKRVLIPVAKRLKMPEDPTGDDTADGGYRFAGVTSGEGDQSQEHLVQADLPISEDAENPGVLKAAALLDMAAYQFNWQGLHPFHYHANDFNLPEESNMQPFSMLQQPLNFGSLRTKQWLDPPDPVEARIDHRYENVEYYETMAGIFALPDGGIVIRDGYGAEIRLTGGSISTNAPGDVWIQSGRNIINYAGDDAIIKARNSIDITATDHDVRLKSEQNLELLSGNGGVGRLLLECKAEGNANDVVGKQGEDVDQGGIIMKAANTDIISWGNNIYLRTGGGDVLGGQITLDADRGGAGIVMAADTISQFVDNAVNILMPADSPTAAYQFNQQACYLPVSVVMGGGLVIEQNGILCYGNISGIQCSVSSDQNDGGQLGDLSGKTPESQIARSENIDALAAAQSGIDMLTKQAKTAVSDATKFLYADKRPGNDKVIENTGYSPRNDDQLNTADFLLPFTYWQQLQVATGDAGEAWTENTISYQGLEMMPHPGKKQWSEQKTLANVELQLYDPATGLDADRGDKYENPKPLAWDKHIPNTSYTVP